MDQLYKILLEVVKPPWNYVFLAVLLLIVYGPKLADLRSAWLDFRLGRRRLELEKEQLEITKLKYEIEVLKRDHNLPGLAFTETVQVPLTTVKEQTPPSPVPKKRIVKYPRLTRATLFAVQIGLGWLAVSFGVTALLVPFVAWKDLGAMTAIGAFVLYALFTWGTYVVFRRVHKLRQSITSSI